jgi:hypothetical protein
VLDGAILIGQLGMVMIETEAGLMQVAPGDWVIKERSGMIWGCEDGQFASLYHAVLEGDNGSS